MSRENPGMKRARVDFVVCAWNNREIISSTLEGIAAQTIKDVTCTLVDDRSTDGTPAMVHERFPWVDVVVKERQTGPSSSRNIGWTRGYAEFVVFLDSDVTLDPHWTEKQIRLLESDPTICAISGKLLYAADTTLLFGAYGAMNRYGVVWDGGRGQPAASFNVRRRCLWGNTTALMVRRECLERVGDFDGDMFTFHEDSDFGWRANIFGYQVIYNPEAEAVHLVHGTLDPAKTPDRLIYLVWRNRLRSILVNYELGTLLRYTSVFLLLSLLEGLVRAPRKPRLSGLLWNLTHLASTLRRRRWVQARRAVRDRDLWHLFEPGIRGPGYGFFPRPNHRSWIGSARSAADAAQDIPVAARDRLR